MDYVKHNWIDHHLFLVQEYNGIIIDKYIDENQHNFKKIIINEEFKKRTILFNIEIGGIYEYFEIGDSIIKQSGSLQVRIIRQDLDTTLLMKFVDLPN